MNLNSRRSSRAAWCDAGDGSRRPARNWRKLISVRPCLTVAPSPVAAPASKLGSGWASAWGSGPAMGGVGREHAAGVLSLTRAMDPEEYARQLDGMGVELAVVRGPEQLLYISHFSDPSPTKRFGTGRSDHRLYFLWQGRGRKASDLALFKKANEEIGDHDVFQFYSADGRTAAGRARGQI